MTRKTDTRNNWITFMFVCKYRYNCLRKMSIIDDCTAAFKELENCGFTFGEFGYGGNHVHFSADVPKKYSITTTITMLKARSARRIFEKHPNFRKRYPKGEFWSGYEHHESTGRKDLVASNAYIKRQQEHHKIEIIDDRQQKLSTLIADQDTASSKGDAE